MGWDGVEVNKNLTKKEIKAKLDDLYKPLDSELVSDVWYGAVPYQKSKRSKKEVFGLVVLVHMDKNEKIQWTKEISEDMGPGCCDCPERIIKLLTPAKDYLSMLWRLDCMNNSKKHTTKNKKTVKLKDLYRVTEYSIDTMPGEMDSHKFGNYYQNSKSKKTPIEWLILDVDNNKSLWEVSAIREWLNKDFYNKAFSKSEKSKICNVALKTGRRQDDRCVGVRPSIWVKF